MVDENFEAFDNLDELDWSDVEDELQQNREQILSEANEEAQPLDLSDMAPDLSEDETGEASAEGAGVNLDINFLLDVQLKISVEVGRTKLLIADLLQLDKGAVLELESELGEPLNIRVNDKLVARGEIVVVHEKFGVRITQIVSPDDRFAALQ